MAQRRRSFLAGAGALAAWGFGFRGRAGAQEPTAPAAAEPLTAERLAALRQRSGAPGLAAAARGPEGRTLDLASGVRLRGDPTAVTPQDLWHLGSITKSMTATLVAKAIEHGAASWELTLPELLPGVEMAGAYRGVTLRHLLSHKSGLPANLPLPRFLRYPREEADARASRRAFAAEALVMPPVGAMGEAFEYSNIGYVVAGAILESLLEEPWESLIQRLLFAPLGIATAGFGAPGSPGAVDQPVGHGAGLLALRPAPPGAPMSDNPAVLGPAGRAHMALADAVRFAAAHRDRSAYLRAESWAVLHTPPFGGDYALGLVARPDGALWHNGSNTMWYAELLIDPGRGVAAVAAANSGVLATTAPAVGEALRTAAQAVA